MTDIAQPRASRAKTRLEGRSYLRRCQTHGTGKYTELKLIELAQTEGLGNDCCELSLDGENWFAPCEVATIRITIDLLRPPPERPPIVTWAQRFGLALLFLGCLATLAPCSFEGRDGSITFGLHDGWGRAALAAGIAGLVAATLVRVFGRWLWILCAVTAATLTYCFVEPLFSNGGLQQGGLQILSKGLGAACGALAAVLVVWPVIITRRVPAASPHRAKSGG